MKEYPVVMGKRQVGKVRILTEGLYYRFQCRCRPMGDSVCRLYAYSGGKQVNLGVVVPMEDGFGLETRIPVKHLPGETVEFILRPKYDSAGERFVPIYPEEPFAYIEKLKDAYLTLQGQQIGIRIPVRKRERCG